MSYRRLLAAPLAAWLAAQPAALVAQEETYIANFEQTELEDVIAIVHEYTGRTIVTDNRIRGQVITFYHQQPMTADELWAAFLQILQTLQYTAVESGGIWRIVPEATQRSEASVVGAGAGAEVVTRTVTVANLQPLTQIVPTLRPMLSQSAHIAAVAGSNELIIVDRADNADRIVEVVRRLDQANTQDVAVVQLQFASAEDVTQKITAVAQAQSGGAPTVQAIPDERTNRVVLTGTASQLDYYRSFAESLDLPSLQGSGSQVRYLYYADAEEVAEILNQQFGGTQVVEDAETAADPTGGNVAITPHIATNSLTISAPSRLQQEMLAVIDALDIPRAQVHIQAIIVEMSEDRAAELGMTWALDGGSGESAAALTNFSGTIGGILQLAQISAGGTPDPSVIGDGVVAAIGNLSDTGTSWAAVVSALHGDAETNVMQLPELVVLDNQEGYITVGQSVPFLTGQYTNAGQGPGGAVNPFSTINREDVGTTLTITPRINEGTGMRLEIAQEVSSLASSAVNAADVITNKREIQTQVFVNDGDILVLGGLLDDQLRTNEQRVPGLGNIPGLRWLFSGRNSERTKSNLMVFIRPTILRDSADAGTVTQSRYRALQDQQRSREGDPVPLLRDAERPRMPALPESLETDELPPQAAPPPVED